MQRGRGGSNNFFGFGDPFGGFGGFGRPGGLISGFFGGRGPFDDPFFTQPFGSLMGPSMFGPSMFGAERNFFGESSNVGFLEQQPPPTKSKGPIIKELSSDDEEEEGDKHAKEKKDNPRKHSRSSKDPYIEVLDEESEEKKCKLVKHGNEFNWAGAVLPQAHTYSFHSSTVTYGGPNGAYYTSSTTRTTGGDGVSLEESKEADTTTGKATHNISRGIRDKGHSVTRKLNTDGRVQTMQTLHNLNEDELSGFEEAWKGKARQHLPGWNESLNMLGNGDNRNGSGSSSSSGRAEPPARGWALPSTEQPHGSGRMRSQSQSRPNSFHRRGRK